MSTIGDKLNLFNSKSHYALGHWIYSAFKVGASWYRLYFTQNSKWNQRDNGR